MFGKLNYRKHDEAYEFKSFDQEETFNYYPEGPVRQCVAKSADLSGIQFDLDLPPNCLMMADPVLQCTFEIERQIVDGVSINRQVQRNTALGAANPLQVKYIPYPENEQDRTYLCADAFPIQTNCSTVTHSVGDKVFNDEPSKHLSAWLQLNKSERLKRVTEGSTAPFKTYYSHDVAAPEAAVLTSRMGAVIWNQTAGPRRRPPAKRPSLHNQS